MHTFFIHHRSSHHAKNSGYSRLLDYFPKATTIYGKETMPYKLAKMISQLGSKKAGLYDSSSVMKEYELYKSLQAVIKENAIIHYLNAERDIRYNVRFNSNQKNHFCASFHKPPRILEERIKNTNYLKKLSGAICVGNNQVEFLKDWLNIDNVQYIPHGVDTNFFMPPEKFNYDTRQKKLLFVGQHMRDFDMFNKVVSILSKEIINLQVDVILRKEYAGFVSPDKSIKVHHNINDQKLKAFYQNADALLLPLRDATACNSILEALACGLPIITSDVGGVGAYLKNTDNKLALSKEEFITETIYLLKNADRLKLLSKQSRAAALYFDWEIVAKQVKEFHSQLH